MSGIAGGNVRLRALEPSDASLLHEWESDPAVWSSSGALHPFSSALIECYITHSSRGLAETGQLALWIESLEGRALGYIHLSDFDPIERRVAIGIYIEPMSRRCGWAKEALSVLLTYLFDTLRCRMIYATVADDNEASKALFASMGFHHTASLPMWDYRGGEPHALNYYQLWHE